MLLRRTFSTLGLGALALAALGCERLVDVELTLVEPCDQKNQALNGVQTFRVTVSGLGADETTTFTRDKGPQPLQVRALGEGATVTLEGWEGSAEASTLSSPPKSIGRTMPLEISESTRDMDIALTMARLDGLAQTTSVDGVCQTMNNAASAPGRHGHTATFIPELNKVLIVGGAVFVDDPGSGQRAESFLKSVELYDPATGRFELVGEMPTTRAYHTATLLPDGRVLIVGGFGIIGSVVQPLALGLIYDPKAPADSAFRRLQFFQERALHTATLLEDAQLVAIVGGCTGPGCRPTGAQNPGGGAPDSTELVNTIELYDIAEDRIVPQPGLLDTPRAMHAASALQGGRLLISGGVNPDGPVCSVEVFEAANGAALIQLAEPGLATFSSCPVGHTQITLERDRVVFIGGQTEAPGGVPTGPGSKQVVFWNIAAGIEAVEGALLSGRWGHASALLNDGSILVVGGGIEAGGATVERLMPQGTVFSGAALAGPPLPESRIRVAVAPLPTNQVFVSGGHSANLITSERAEIYYGE